MKIWDERIENELTVFISGELDLTGAPELTAFLDGKLNDVASLVIDMKGITYLSSAGIRAILTAYRAMGNNSFRIVNCNPIVYEVFEITGLSDALSIEKAE